MARFPFLRLVLLLFTLSCTQASALGLGGVPLHDLPAATIRIGGHPVRALLATTQPEHETGLMFRERLPENEGMLFVYDTAKVRCMWMKNTLIPLTAAFLDADGRILNLEDMAPGTTQSHCSAGPVLYVLEMNRGWFERRGLGAGVSVDLSEIGTAR